MLNVIEEKIEKMAAEKNFLVLGIFFVLKIKVEKMTQIFIDTKREIE